MQPKTPSDLDPKLKATYERIMGTSVPSPTPAAPVSSSPAPASPPTTPPSSSSPAGPPQQPAPNQTPDTATPAQTASLNTQPPVPPIGSPLQQTPRPTASPFPEQTPPPESSSPLTRTDTFQPPISEIFSPVPDSEISGQPAQIFKASNPFSQTETPPDSTLLDENKNQNAEPKKRGKAVPVFIFLGVVLFFVVYTVVWAKVFGLF